MKLSDNLFGDSLNPIFSTAQFRPLHQLRTLDLSGNKIKALEEGIFKGCENLQVISPRIIQSECNETIEIFIIHDFSLKLLHMTFSIKKTLQFLASIETPCGILIEHINNILRY